MSIRFSFLLVGLLISLVSPVGYSQGTPISKSEEQIDRVELIERGRYMVVTGHCNNCHTNGYATSAGATPENAWLAGNSVGWRSKQGTVYAPNLRIYLQSMDVGSWLLAARNARPRAPMPWWSLSETSDKDLVAMYWYIRSLQPIGSPAPLFLPPNQVPKAPYNQLPDLSLAQ